MHLKAKSSYRAVRTEEMKELRYMSQKVSELYKPDFEFLIGDFNDTPDAPFIKELTPEFSNSYL